MSVPGLDELLSEEGWPYASTPPVEEGDPGRFHALFGRDSLITSLQVLPARPEVARATLRLAQTALRGPTLLVDSRITLACVEASTFRPKRLPRPIFDAFASSPRKP